MSEGVKRKTLCLHGTAAWILPTIFIVGCIVLFMYLLRKFIQGPFYRKRNRIDGKVVIITGANAGLGRQTALELAYRGARIYMACRDSARCEATRLEIIEKTQNQEVYNRILDLASLESVRQFAARFLEEEQHLDILINNAGLMAIPRKITAEGYETQFGVNHLGHFLLTHLLLECLKSSAPSRIVVISSMAHLAGRINKDDLNGEKRYRRFFGAYCQSKLANILFTRKLAELLNGTQVTANVCTPGIVRTALWQHNGCPAPLQVICNLFFRFFAKSPEAGAQTILRLALDPALEASSGDYYMDSMRCPLPPWARDKEMADWLWQKSEEMVGLRLEQPTDGIETIIVRGYED